MATGRSLFRCIPLLALNRSPGTALSFLMNKMHRCSTLIPKIALKFSEHDKRRFFRMASKGDSSESEVKRALDLSITVCRIQQILPASPHLRCRIVYKQLSMQITKKSSSMGTSFYYEGEHILTTRCILGREEVPLGWAGRFGDVLE